MNMSEDVTAVSMQVSEKAAEAALSAFKSVLDSVGRLFRELLGMEHDRARAKAQMKASKGGSLAPEKTKPPNVSATNLTGIKPGEVSLKGLAENARNTGEALSVAQNGFSQEDRRAIARAAKKYGIPVAFSNTKGKNNLYANVRSGDLPIFKQICTECIKTALLSPKEKLRRLHRNIYIFIIVAGIFNIFFPLVAHADIFNNDVQDVYATITENVDETNEILKSAFRFTQVSPYSIVNSVGGAAGGIGVAIRTATKNLALIVSVLLLMVEFFRKTTNFEWSSKWENILIFLVKLIVVKQVVQNADLIIEYIYKGFNTINTAATSSNMDFLPAGHKVTYSISIQESLLHDVVQADHWYQGWIRFWEHVGAGETRHAFTYTISQDAVKMFYPHAIFPSGTAVRFEDHAFGNPTSALTFNPTIEIILWQPYFLAMKAIAYMIFVVTIGRIFELAVYTIFAPLPIATFASDTTHDVAKSFIKNYIATVIQIAVIVVMFIVYLAVAQYFANHTSGLSSLKLIQFIALISLGLGVMKSGNWAKKICGAA